MVVAYVSGNHLPAESRTHDWVLFVCFEYELSHKTWSSSNETIVLGTPKSSLIQGY